MDSMYRSLLTVFFVLPMCFFSSPGTAQDEVQLLHSGLLLGYTGGIENEAALLAPTAFGQVFGEPVKRGTISGHSHPQRVLSLRLGNFSFEKDSLEDLFDNVFFYGIGGTRNFSDNFSLRVSADYISDDSLVWASPTRVEKVHDISMFSIKTTALLHPAAGTLGGSGSGYFNPYLGLGFEINLTDTYYNFDEGENIQSNSDFSVGIHCLAGIEYVFSVFSLGLEISYNASEATARRSDGSYAELDIGGLAILLNVGFHF